MYSVKPSRKWGYEFEVMTLAKALGLALLPSEEDKRIRHVGQPVLVNYVLVVLDEASMAPKMSIDIVEGALAFSGTKLLSMGDDCQLPPRQRVVQRRSIWGRRLS